MPSVSRRAMLAMTGAAVALRARGVSARRMDMKFLSAIDFAGALARRELSAVEALEDAIARIEAFDTRVNAVVVRDFERARIAAAAADRAIARGDRRALLGVPMTVKESFEVGGLATTWGVPADRRIAAADEVAVMRLKSAGAVILGKTNVPFKLGDWQSYNEIYGVTRNPWDLERTPGGSSGGSAAALAAGYVPLEIGSDIAGSIRVPAHFCGVYGHKPTSGNIPGAGHLAVFGPMARSASDLSLALDILLGPNAVGSPDERLALLPARHRRLEDYRVLLLDSHPLLPTSKSVVGALDRRVDALMKRGVKVRRSSPLLPDLAASGRMYAQLLDSYNVWNLPAEQLQPALYTEQAIAAVNKERLRAAAQWQALFKEFDVVLCPIMPTAAFRHDHSAGLHTRRIDVDGREVPYVDQIMWPGVATFTGLPATAAPLELNEAGLPIGAQIVGPFLEDRTTIEFARLMEEAFGGFRPPPHLE